MRRIGLAIVALVFIPSDPHLTTSAGPVVSAFQLNPITQHNTQNVQSQNFHYKNISTARKATPSPNAGLNQGGSLADLPNIRAAVIVPGFLTGKSEFEPLAASLTAKGIPTVVVPMGNWHWLPCLGGRSMRPMLDRIDFTVRHLAAVAGNLGDFETVSQEGLDKSVEDAVSAQAIGGLMPSLTKETMASIKEDPRKVTKQTNPQFLIPNFSYNAFDCWQDFRNNPGGVLKVGGSAEVEEYPLWTPKGSFPEAPEPMGKVALIGHSAGGW